MASILTGCLELISFTERLNRAPVEWTVEEAVLLSITAANRVLEEMYAYSYEQCS
jgi:hypothetical protein